MATLEDPRDREQASDDWLTVKQVASALGVHEETVRDWREKGCPWFRVKRRIWFDPQELRGWLLDNGLASEEHAPAEEIITKRREIAARFGVPPRTVSDWQGSPGFPGENGCYPVLEIARWLITSGKQTKPPADLLDKLKGESEAALERDSENPAARLTRSRAEKAELELAQLKGEVIDAEEVIRFYRRCNSHAVTILRGAPGRCLAALPSNVPEEIQLVIQETVGKVVDESLEMVSELIRGDQDEVEDGDESE